MIASVLPFLLIKLRFIPSTSQTKIDRGFNDDDPAAVSTLILSWKDSDNISHPLQTEVGISTGLNDVWTWCNLYFDWLDLDDIFFLTFCIQSKHIKSMFIL